MPNFIQLTTPLILHADPILPSHAATKQYVDNKRSSISASAFTTGLITVARMPALTGDVTSVAGTGVISLNTNGVAAGTYPKVTVDATGRVTAGGTLVAADIATVSWTKITTGKPTTAAGYGITNLISLSGGTASGNIASTATPSVALHAVTKGYVDNAITGVVSASLSTGDVVRKTLTVAPSGFLRCNGSVVSRTTYAALFAVIGTTYNKATAANSGGKPWVMQYDFNTTQTTNISSWSTYTALPTPIRLSHAIVTKNYVFLLGGEVNGAISSQMYRAPINADGTLGTWGANGTLPITVREGQVVIVKDRIYLLGGWTSGALSSIQTAVINTDGTLGTWTTSTSSLPVAVYAPQAIVTNGRIHVMGGFVGGSEGTGVYTAVVNADGTLGTWTAGTSLSSPLGQSQAVVTNSRVYIFGGQSSATVITAPINADGTLGTWTTGTPYPGQLYRSQAVVTNSRVYLIGGVATAGSSATVYTAPVNTDGTLGTWTTGTSLPSTVIESHAVVTNSRIFLLGGNVNNASSATVHVASFLGGFNDYTSYTAIITTATTDFTLPDFTSLEKNNLNYFIKT